LNYCFQYQQLKVETKLNKRFINYFKENMKKEFSRNKKFKKTYSFDFIRI